MSRCHLDLNIFSPVNTLSELNPNLSKPILEAGDNSNSTE